VKLKAALISVACVALLGGGIYYFLKSESLPDTVAPAGSTAKAAMSFADNKITEQENGRIVWEIKAEAIEIDGVTQDVLLHQVQGTFYSDKGTTMVITSKEGTVSSKTRDVLLTGDVHAVASDGGDLTTPELLWQGQTKLLFGSGGVKVVKGTSILTGDKLEGDSVLNKIKVTGNAHVVTKEDNPDGL